MGCLWRQKHGKGDLQERAERHEERRRVKEEGGEVCGRLWGDGKK